MLRSSFDFSYFCNLFRTRMKDITTIFRALLLAVSLLMAGWIMAQEPCEITCNTEMPVCSGSAVTLSVPSNYLYTYQWSPGGQTTNSITVRPEDNTSYSVVIKDLNTDTLVCQSDPFEVKVMPQFSIDFQQMKLTCSNRNEQNGRNAQVVAWVDPHSESYAKPFAYQWDVSPLHIAPGCDSLAIGLEAYRYYKIKVTDSRGCIQWDSVTLRAYPNPLVEISTDPGDTVYMQNPHVTYSFENTTDSIPVSNFYWVLNTVYNLTSTEQEPRFTYVETGSYTTELKVYNPQGCDTSYYKNIQVEPVKLKIPSVFTPNGDGVNDYFIIALDNGSNGGSSGDGERGYREGGLEYENYEPLNRYYESSELTIFNRWGRVVFHSKDYQNNWDGGGLSDGTYFYVLKCHGLKQDATYNGSVMIVTAQRQ